MAMPPKKPTNGSKTKPFNSRLMTPKELTGLPKKTTAKATPKPTAKPKPKLSKSERDFLAGQKLKKKITKKTGVYPNTAN
jgi:hypothetical protein